MASRYSYVCLPLFGRSAVYVCVRSKAVAIGAVSHYLNNFVVGRLVRYTYGIPVSIPYNNSDPEHLKRLHKVYRGITGELQFDVFSPTLSKVAAFTLVLCAWANPL